MDGISWWLVLGVLLVNRLPETYLPAELAQMYINHHIKEIELSIDQRPSLSQSHRFLCTAHTCKTENLRGPVPHSRHPDELKKRRPNNNDINYLQALSLT